MHRSIFSALLVAIWCALAAACGGGDGGGTDSGVDADSDADSDSDTDADTDSDGDADAGDDAGADTDTDTAVGPCPAGMALAGDACVDKWEASLVGWSPYDVPGDGVAASVEGVVPQGYISGEVAESACAAAGKRLCTLDEWLRACQGPETWTWPYGDTYVDGACNDTYPGTHPVVDYFGTSVGVWDSEHMNNPGINQQPDTVDETGANPACVTTEGIFDMHGNLHEWIADPAGTFKGGFYADASINGPGCTYTTTAHAFGYHDYSTGFRCCGDPAY
jgi:hypothetical protein